MAKNSSPLKLNNININTKTPVAPNKSWMERNPGLTTFFIVFGGLVVMVIIGNIVHSRRNDVGGETVKNISECKRVFTTNGVVTAESNSCATKINEQLTSEQMKNCGRLESDLSVQVTTGGDTSVYVSNFSSSTGFEASEDAALSFYGTCASGGTYVQYEDGELVSERTLLEEVEYLKGQVAANEAANEAAEEAEAAEAEERATIMSQINSYNTTAFENGGIIRLTNPDNEIRYVKFSTGSESQDVVELVGDPSTATPVGIFNSRLIMEGQSAATCFPFASSMAYNLSGSTSNDSLLEHPCINDTTSKLTMGPNNSIEKIGNKCFVMGEGPDGIALGETGCDSLLAEIVNPEDISDNSLNEGMGPQVQATE